MVLVYLCSSVGVVAHARVRKVRVPLSKRPSTRRHPRRRPLNSGLLLLIFIFHVNHLSLVTVTGSGRYLSPQILYLLGMNNATGCCYHYINLNAYVKNFLHRIF